MARSCGTCRDRRILCDRATPSCAQCARSNRVCKGYGIRLSWPKTNNAKRAVVGAPLRGRRGARQLLSSSLVNVSDFDIKMHYYLSNSLPLDASALSLTVPIPFTILEVTDTDAQLFAYFESTASRSLAILGRDPVSLGHTLLRMALANTSASSQAVRYAILALSSLHRYELQEQCFTLKISAIKALNEATHAEIGPAEALQHVAAGMLLCSFEIHKASCTSSQWLCFVTGVKQVLNASCWLRFRHDATFGVMIDWVYYHEVMSRFSLLHWGPAACLNNDPPSAVCAGGYQVLPTPTNKLLRLFKTACYLLTINKDLPACIGHLQTLYGEIQSLPLSDSNHTSNPDLTLFHLATLIYLNRITSSLLLLPDFQTESQITTAFALLKRLKTCPRQFPLFIIGCEARTDEQRCVVLDLIERTERSASSRSTFIVNALVNRVWVQDDLAGERGVPYRDKVDAVVSVCSLLPTFV
ncbi:hypothetical protein BJX64DRAFT_252132 [Aspergillus heterothallicus]